MGYLQIPVSALPNFSKAVISVWFRVPAATFTLMDAISDVVPGPSNTDHMCSSCYSPALFKVIPLITFGSLEIDNLSLACSPSFIGIDCWQSERVLQCNLQTPVNGAQTGTGSYNQRPGCFFMGGFAGGATDTVISADLWHHALISFDISGSQTATYVAGVGSYASASTFSWALDDVSRPLAMAPNAGAQWGIANNAIITQWLLDGVGGSDTASFSGGYIASNGNPIGIPASSAFVSNGQKVELAELQIFTGVTTDAAIEANRRAFIATDGTPANMYLAEALLGQAPNIKLTGSNNWKTGANTGSLGTTFTPTGTITTYTTAPDITP